MKTFIEKAWDGYRAMVLPPNAGSIQINETRQAFFGGAATIFSFLMLYDEVGREVSEDEMAERMVAIQAELKAYGDALDKRMFGAQSH